MPQSKQFAVELKGLRVIGRNMQEYMKQKSLENIFLAPHFFDSQK